MSSDQFVCRTPGRLPDGYGREGGKDRFNGGTIYNDATSGLIWVENQVSLGANETVMGKERFEQWMLCQCLSISMGTTVFSHLKNIVRIVPRRCNCSLSRV